jgi:hypothetical protein
MPYNFDQLLDELGGPKMDVWLKDGNVLEGVAPTSSEPGPRRYAAEPTTPEAEPAASPLPIREAAAPAPRQQQAAPRRTQEDDGIDWSRALTALSGGQGAVANLDSMRAGKARQALDEKQDARKAEADEFSLGEQKRRAEVLRSASDPNSDTSKRMREELLTGFEVIGDSMPNMKPTLQKFAGSMQNMSATDMIAMQERMGGIFNIARQAGHDRASEAKAGLDRDLKERQIDATISDKEASRGLQYQGMQMRGDELRDRREERLAAAEAKAAEREEHANEKDIAAYEKDAGPIDMNLKTLGEVKNSKVHTGWVPDKYQKVRQFVGMKDDAWDTEEAALADVENEIRHGLFGGALSPGEKAEFLKAMPDMSMPRAARDAKLTAIMKRMAEKKQQIGSAHPRAVRTLGEKKAAKAPPGAPPGKVIKSPDGKRYKVSDDGLSMNEVR